MPEGIRTTVEFTTPDVCPIVECSDATESTIDSVTTNVCPPDCSESVTEFATEGEAAHDELEEIFSHGSLRWYRRTHGDGAECPCECLGQFGCPVARYVAREGTLTLVFHATDYEELQTLIGELRDRFPGIDVKRLIRSPAGEKSRDSVLVDRSKLTARQFEVLQTAYEMGYFERPRRANATEVADALEVSPSTFREHVARAESKLLGDVFSEG